MSTWRCAGGEWRECRMSAPAALALLVSVLLAWGCGGGPTVGSEPGVPAVSGPGGEERGQAQERAYHVRFDMLAVERARMLRPARPLARNPFRFDLSSQQQSISASYPLWDEPVVWADSPALDPLTWPDSVADAWSNPTPLVLIGVIEAPASAGRVAVLTDGDTVYHGRVGDVLGEYARIVSITPPSIELEPPGGSPYTVHMAP